MSSITPLSALAAIDLGSNSFHLLVATINKDGSLTKLDSLRESVRLLEGLTPELYLTEEVQQRGLHCLEQFRQRIEHLPKGAVRIAGTNTLRRALNAKSFLDKAQRILGHPIEIISGHEEARLIYLGVAQNRDTTEGNRLVIDIGGGSTELIIGKDMRTLLCESLSLGCVSHSLQFFPDGLLTEERFAQAITAAKLAILPVFQPIANGGWQHVIGCSGSIKAIHRIVQKEEWSNEGITYDALQELKQAMIEAGHINALQFKSLKESRRAVLPGGLSVLLGLFEIFDIQLMERSKQALREGLLYDLVGRIGQSDIRSQTIYSHMQRWQVDQAQSNRVQEIAKYLYHQVKVAWQIEDERFLFFLTWAAQLHEIGLYISHRRYQQHGAYILTHADLPGFSYQEQQLLATLVLHHRRKFNFQPNPDFNESIELQIKYLCVLLRMAVLLCRKRSDEPAPPIALIAKDNELTLQCSSTWLLQKPLLYADLQSEIKHLAKSGITLHLAAFEPFQPPG